MTYPSRTQAQTLWQLSVDMRAGNPEIKHNDEYIAHTTNVAKCAETVAKKCGMNAEKAYALGLLHDFGKSQKEFATGVFHGTYGYNFFKGLGFDDVAKICLTHTFVKNPIDRDNYTHRTEWLDWADNLLKEVVYDDYDKLIQVCDLFAEKLGMITIEQRWDYIATRYKLTEDQKQQALKKSLPIKQYFDAKCGCDVYDLVGIKK